MSLSYRLPIVNNKPLSPVVSEIFSVKNGHRHALTHDVRNATQVHSQRSAVQICAIVCYKVTYCVSGGARVCGPRANLQTFVLPPLLARGPSRLGVWGTSSPACVWGGAPTEDEFGAF